MYDCVLFNRVQCIDKEVYYCDTQNSQNANLIPCETLSTFFAFYNTNKKKDAQKLDLSLNLMYPTTQYSK